jgi:hypothetical protein
VPQACVPSISSSRSALLLQRAGHDRDALAYLIDACGTATPSA